MQIINQYLEECKDILATHLFENPTAFDRCQVSYGFPHERALCPSGAATGAAWTDDNKKSFIVISPIIFTLDNELEVLHTLAHEMIHIEIGPEEKHGKYFQQRMKQIGLTGKAQSSEPDEKFLVFHRCTDFPQYPNEHLVIVNVAEPKPAKKKPAYVCPCGRKISVPKKLIEEGGLICGNCNEEFISEELTLKDEQQEGGFIDAELSRPVSQNSNLPGTFLSWLYES